MPIAHPTAAYIAQHEAPCSLPAIFKSLTMALAGGYVFHYLSSPLPSVPTPPLVTLSSLASLLVVAGRTSTVMWLVWWWRCMRGLCLLLFEKDVFLLLLLLLWEVTMLLESISIYAKP
jgi:hypothetical protein